MYLVLCGQLPFDGRKDKQLKEAIKSQPIELKSKKLKHVSKEAKSLLHLLLQKDLNMRPKASQVLEHKWFKSATRKAISKKVSENNRFKLMTMNVRVHLNQVWLIANVCDQVTEKEKAKLLKGSHKVGKDN